MSKYIGYITLLGIRGTALLLKFALSIFIAKYVGLDELGQFGLVIGLTLLIPTILKFGVFLNISRDFVIKKNSSIKAELMSYSLITTLIYILFSPIGYVIFDEINANNIFKFNYFYLPLLIYSEHLITDSISTFNSIGLVFKANLTSLIQALFNVIPIFVAYLIFQQQINMNDLIKYWTIGNFLTFIIIVAIWGKGFFCHGFYNIEFKWFLNKVKASYYLYFNELTSVIYSITDRYLIAILMNIKFVGIYTFYLQLINAAYTLINSSIISAYKSKILDSVHNRDFISLKKHIKFMIFESVGILLILSVIFVFLMPLFSKIINKPDVMFYINIFYILILIFVIRVIYTVYTTVLYAYKMDLFLFKNLLLCVFLNFVFSFVLSKLTSIYSIPLALLISFAIGLVTCISAYRKTTK